MDFFCQEESIKPWIVEPEPFDFQIKTVDYKYFELFAAMWDKGVNSYDKLSKAIDVIFEQALDSKMAIDIINKTIVDETSQPELPYNPFTQLLKLKDKPNNIVMQEIFHMNTDKQAELDDLLYSLDLMYRQSQQIEDGYAIHLSRFKLIREAVEGFYAKGFQDADTLEMKLIV